ncbi:MAG: HEPN-associated N-terminal domain-containing protein [Methylobacter sp.]|uniref:HEPN-associated N-terminal domain-containing protein n=1 Tax=Candidatus Methylobacter titanis TaxID=3053457 RepID=A0AA43Q4S6_9GAMM|nr:HEPN-associated N-terminal domain-containing protein [Candidatus Methylobacter titanis]
MMEADERGWNAPDGYVCPDCVEDDFLKEIIRENACHRKCDYCGRRTRSHSAAPVEVLMGPIANVIFCYFNNPVNAYLPYDSEEGGWLIDSTDIYDVLASISLDCHPQLLDVIANAFVHNEWVETAGGIWTGSHPHEEMSYEWDRFTKVVKHELRYFFDHARSSSIDEEYEPATLLPTIGRLVKRLNLTETLPMGTSLFRARPRNSGESWLLDAKQLGAPPSEKARAGRMNPAGISYLYLAFDRETTLAEIQHSQSDQSAIGQFEVSRDLRVLNLIQLPNLPSIFDNEHRDEAEALIFLASFIKEITNPVEKNGSEHIEYVPTQVVSEYFALVFELKIGERLDGILYPSAVAPGGRNLVLFPTERGYERKFDQVDFVSASMAQGS